MNSISLPSPTFFSSDVYRNIATVITSQELYDDIVDTPAEMASLQTIDALSSQIDHLQAGKNRVFQYGDIENSQACFMKENWWRSRYSDGSFGVWYGALEKETSLIEALYWQLKFTKEDRAGAKAPIQVERRIHLVHCETKSSVDLRPFQQSYQDLTNPLDYAFCNQLGRYAKQNSIDLYQAPSVRKPGGTSIPLFNSEAIVSDKISGYARFTLFNGISATISLIDNQDFQIPESWEIP